MKKRKWIRRQKKFNPDREYIEKATQEYLAAGGVITKEECREPDDDDGYTLIGAEYCGPGRIIGRNFPIGYFG